MSTLFIYSRVEEESLENSEHNDGIVEGPPAKETKPTTSTGTDSTFVGK